MSTALSAQRLPASRSPTIAIVGGGIMGMGLGYRLTQLGATVDVFEAEAALGGMAGTITLENGASVDRFYHTILSSDLHLRRLCSDLGIGSALRFRKTRMGFHYNGAVFSMNNILEFMRFPPLNWLDRLRLGMTVLSAQLVRDWRRLESVSVEKWLCRLSGQRTYRTIWRPLLRAKFDGDFDTIPATWMWARLTRMKSARRGASQREEAGHLVGGYAVLMQALSRQIELAGGAVYLDRRVDEIIVENGSVRGVRIGDETIPYKSVVAALPTPTVRDLLPTAPPEYVAALGSIEYLGIVCPLVVLDRPLTGFWTLNITDEDIPFTGIIETTAYIDPQYVGGNHLVYLPKYTCPGSPWQNKSDEEIRDVWLNNLERVLPHFDRRWIRSFHVLRAQHVEPLHRLNSIPRIPSIKAPIAGFYLVTTAQIYPALTNLESIWCHVRAVAGAILDTHRLPYSGAR